MTREPDDYFTGVCPTCGQAYLRTEVERLKAENARLMALLETVAQRMEEQ